MTLHQMIFDEFLPHLLRQVRQACFCDGIMLRCPLADDVLVALTVDGSL